MKIEWRLRTVAAQHGIWTAAALQQELLERAGCDLSRGAVVALLTREPRELNMSILAALCVAIGCSPAELLELRTSGDQEVAGHEGRGPSNRGIDVG